MPHAALWVVQHKTSEVDAIVEGFNAARGFVGGADRRSQPLSP